MEHLISVIIATYNRGSMLKDAIESVLRQQNVQLDIVVVDDASTDNTTEIIENFQRGLTEKAVIRYFRNETNKGLLYNHLFGFRQAKGDVLVFMDDDDYYTDDGYFYRAAQKLDEDKSLSMVAANVKFLYVQSRKSKDIYLNVKGFMSNSDYLSNFQFKYSKPASTFPAVFRKRKLDEAGFNGMQVMNDSSIYMRSLLTGHAYLFTEIIGVYRLHGGNRSCDNGSYFLENIQEKYRILKEGKQIIQNPRHWWYKQFTLTYNYYISAQHKLEDEFKIVEWGLKHADGSKRLKCYLLYRKFILRSKLN